MSGKNEWKLPLLNSYLEKWARETPDAQAMIQAEDGRAVTYEEFVTMIDLFALRLQAMGLKKGDRLATLMVTFPEHFYLMYACFKLGVIIAPLDVRLKDNEVVRDLEKIEPKAFFFLGNTPLRDFRSAGKAVKENCPYVEHLVQFTPDPQPGDVLEDAISITEMMDKAKLGELVQQNVSTKELEKAYSQIEPRTPAMIIYTTGTTGEPKPAVLCHENIIVQNEILKRGMDLETMGIEGNDFSMVVNLPPSHVAGTTEVPFTMFYLGATAILLRIFDPKNTLEAAEKYKSKSLGMVPTQFRMLWGVPDYDKYDLSSLLFAAYAGSAVEVDFLRRLSEMAPYFGTGIGMTENAGFATFTPLGISIEEMAGQVGRPFPELAEVSIREPMNDDGTAGKELADGETGEICYHPPIVFLGYYEQPEATARTISKEGILYTGDLGYFKDMGSYRALYLAGRKKFVIKQKGYNVFPDEVQNYIASHPKVAAADVIGMPHKLYDEGILAFVQPVKGEELTPDEIMQYCQEIASYKRPQHVEIWPADKLFPMNRVGKIDKLELQVIAEDIIEKLRAESKWDK